MARCTTTAGMRGCTALLRGTGVFVEYPIQPGDRFREGAGNRADSRARVVVGGQCVDVDGVKPDASAWSWAIRSDFST